MTDLDAAAERLLRLGIRCVESYAWRDLDELLDDADELDLLESSDDESFDPAPDPTTTTAASSAPGDEGKKSKRKRKNDVEHGAARTRDRGCHSAGHRDA